MNRDDETWTQYDKRLTRNQKAEVAAWQKARRWRPHPLRHSAATELRKELGLQAARIILGHRSPAITEVYAEKDEGPAQIAAKLHSPACQERRIAVQD